VRTAVINRIPTGSKNSTDITVKLELSSVAVDLCVFMMEVSID
jgi:hypothetical protein